MVRINVTGGYMPGAIGAIVSLHARYLTRSSGDIARRMTGKGEMENRDWRSPLRQQGLELNILGESLKSA
jgi:hypothetical protein